ncbi:hypothetical protein BDQ94DRAFT_181607 [Aspergillus welwitschiae]|uniref:Zn(2)-C6 fungal-type domain-containing protein n=1 Tax=Aspergillus welwitschiae TaxID=1341132 RepID=A0A3F3PTK0_9EURO|nr:hypothetical protein BDQ94DRAFT_181607 [Aspergillus welwitschiae]RDH30291.1 hypothetical protein BDQ94DRAFT_181607 [Aspergillus welwitschiae]
MAPRRKHKKSRLGCIECKRRRIKCDEQRPVCSQCTISERTCEFAEMPARCIRPTTSRRQTPSIPASSTGETAESSSTVAEADSPIEPAANLLHAELLYQLLTETIDSINEQNSPEIVVSPAELIRCSLRASYLLNELLALAATHLSIIRSEQHVYYRTHATHLQNHALRFFHAMDNADDPEACVPRFFFSSILGLHTLCETLIFRDGDFNIFLDSFVPYLRLHQGVRAVIGDNWSMLSQTTSLGPTLGSAGRQLQTDGNLGPECRHLLALIRQSNLGPSITETYRQAIEALQAAMHSISSNRPGGACITGVFAWPASVPSKYIDLLALRSPDALAVLAHYGVVLHAYRQCWFLGDGGRYLIESINDYLGPAWSEWLAYPRQVLSAGSHQY